MKYCIPSQRTMIGYSLWTLLLLCGEMSSAAEDLRPGEPVNFQRDVRPIFNEHCVACHGGVKQAGGLSFAYAESVGEVVEANDADASLIIDRILLPPDEDEHMPPSDHGRSLNGSEVKILRDWIDQGAVWGEHWSFVVPHRADLPGVANHGWPRQRMDHFVLSGLESANLQPEPDASPERWLRRASLDLIGLPPTPEEVREFKRSVGRHGEPAYQQQVNSLLASEAFGQRWASVWLDVVRYADSRGLGADGRRSIWQYRDWVIRAFNSDMPYDQFTIKQLAGDLLPGRTMDDLIATACHRTTQSNEEGGTDDETFRVEAVMDRTNTTWQAWQGISFGCVQCHSHPYDPIEHIEYYEFLAYFNNTIDTDLNSDAPNLAVPIDPADYQRAFELDQKANQLWEHDWRLLNDLAKQESNWQSVSGLDATTNNSTQVVVVPGNSPEYATTGTVARSTKITLDADLPSGLGQITALRFTGLPKDESVAKVDSEWGFVMSSITASVSGRDGKERELKFVDVVADEPFPLTNPKDSLNEKTGWGFGAYSRIYQPRSGVFLLDQPLIVSAGERIKVSMSFNITETGSFPLIAHRGRISLSAKESFLDWRHSDELAEQRKELSRLRADRRSIRSVSTPVLQERRPEFARMSHLFERGNQTVKTDRVQPSVPEFLPHSPKRNSEATRLQMATWIASADNPLTARVITNRVWAQLFGVGIVETQEDFGVAGTAPSNQLLLDDLAARFQTDMQWSIKALLREIVTSSSYRQSAAASSEKIAADPANRLVSRGSNHRLPAETVRDQALAIAGLLDRRGSGPPVHPPIPTGVWNPFSSGDRWTTPGRDSGDRYRRTLFTYVKRTIPYPFMASFDAPSREFCATRRLNSNTPLQALMTLNDATFTEAAAAFAARMSNDDADVGRQIAFGFTVATGRPPTENELAALQALYDQALYDQAIDQSDPKQTAEDALQSIATVILNLDEVLTQ